MKKESDGKADVVVYCHEGSHYSKESGQPQSEGMFTSSEYFGCLTSHKNQYS